MIDEKDLAELMLKAKLKLTQEEVKDMLDDISRHLAYVEQLLEADKDEKETVE